MQTYFKYIFKRVTIFVSKQIVNIYLIFIIIYVNILFCVEVFLLVIKFLFVKCLIWHQLVEFYWQCMLCLHFFIYNVNILFFFFVFFFFFLLSCTLINLHKKFFLIEFLSNKNYFFLRAWA